MADRSGDQRGTRQPVAVCVLAAAAIGALALAPICATLPSEARSVDVALTSAADAQAFLTGPGLINVPGLDPDQWPAKSMAGFLSSDTQLANSQLDHQPTSFGTFVATTQNGFYDLFHEGALTNGAVADAGTVLPGAAPWSDAMNLLNLSDKATVLTPPAGYTPAAPGSHFDPTAGAGPGSAESASQLLNDVEHEQTIVTGNVTAVDNELLQLEVAQHWPTTGALSANELGPLSDTGMLQVEINDAVGALGPISAADEHNLFLISDLSSLLGAENSMNDTLVDTYTSLSTGDLPELTADNAALAHNGADIFTAAQDTVSFFAFEDFLSSIGL